ncbi:uncharacterized protein LOC105436256 [Cucumis sativus]|uniref:DUF7086 domain-containing protein n=1 Tax=Cucumis sativus TaxID=3659 RepID=A0A0A0K3Q8_CUCSA|nr:uncharacterized protein LOC105436256 [Cucumis sativus]KGN44335.1 hypothetical protein Csa_015666 [Cucumis sativus]
MKITIRNQINERHNGLDLRLSLRPPSGHLSSQPSAAPIGHARPNAVTNMRVTRSLGTRRSSHQRCNSRSPRTTETIEPPYPWSTNRRAMVRTLNDLKSNQILQITGDVQCRQCQVEYTIEYDMDSKFEEIASFVEENKNSFRDRAPQSWMNPNYPTCRFCGHENGARPVIPKQWRKINWLFLLLGEMLGVLNLNHLKYFCSNTYNHRTGAKNRLLYLTYITLCHQVDPSGRFNRV